MFEDSAILFVRYYFSGCRNCQASAQGEIDPERIRTEEWFDRGTIRRVGEARGDAWPEVKCEI